MTVIKSRRKRWAEHVARIGELRKVYKSWSKNLKGSDHLEDLGVDGKVIRQWIFEK
jgi:hypothetical protein